MSQGSTSSHSSQSATSKAPVVVVDAGSSPSLDLQPAQPSLGVSSRTRSRRSLVVKELNWTTSESSQADITPGLPLDPAAEALEGSPEEAEREAEASLKVIEPPAVVLACEHMDSIMTPARLQSLLESCNPGCTLGIPKPGERCHRFDTLKPGTGYPKAVLSTQFFRLGLSLPLHPFILEVLDFYEVSPMQLTPNSYRMAVCLYILYDIHHGVRMSALELGWFFQLKITGRTPGFFYLTAWNTHHKKGIKGNRQSMSDWQKLFLYCYDCPVYRKYFNLSPNMLVQTPLAGESLERAEHVLGLSTKLGDGSSLLTPENLERLGFSTTVIWLPTFPNSSSAPPSTRTFGEASGSQAPIPAKPLSQLPSPSLEQKKASSGSRKRDPSKAVEAGSSAEGRSSKKPKLALARSSPAPSSTQKTQLFQRMLFDQVPEATIREWDRLSIAEATRDKVVANAKSLFLDLKMGEHVADTARVNETMRADLKQARADLASAVKERDAFQKANLKFKEAEAKAQQLKEKEDMVRRGLEEEVDGLRRQVKELELKVKGLQDAAATVKAGRKDREATIFEAGVAAGIKDCVKSAYRFFPENDWARLRPDAAVALEEAKAEDEAGIDKALAASLGLSGDGGDKGVTAEDEPKPAELVSAGLVVTPPEGVLAVAPAVTSQDPPAVDEKDSSSPAAL
ncbi:hypothetical protein ACET3Z_021111 [Daucus carota]